MDRTSQLPAPVDSRAEKPAATTHVVWPPLLTRKQLLEFLNSEGIPIGKSTLDKLCALGHGPPVFAWWGRLALHRPADSLGWAMARLRLVHPGGVTRSEDDRAAGDPAAGTIGSGRPRGSRAAR
jgi:hypothetical protein